LYFCSRNRECNSVRRIWFSWQLHHDRCCTYLELPLSIMYRFLRLMFQGDQIELMLNRRFPISTMAAAALGNTVSDVIGIGSVHYVEMFAQKIGFEAPKLTLVQLNLPRTRIAANVVRNASLYFILLLICYFIIEYYGIYIKILR